MMSVFGIFPPSLVLVSFHLLHISFSGCNILGEVILKHLNKGEENEGLHIKPSALSGGPLCHFERASLPRAPQCELAGCGSSHKATERKKPRRVGRGDINHK